ncbi:MAG: O-antigen ligase family protein [Lachnospiraceae bacterium]|nr:O-antigen ligase family protein [Lachnospiraceae bacterium]
MSTIKRAARVKELLSLRFMKEIVSIYLFLMFVIYPLYYENRYYNMGEAKWNFFKFWSYSIRTDFIPWFPSILLFMVAFFIWYQVDLYRKGGLKEYWDFKKNSILDLFVYAYLALCLISTILSPYKDTIIDGYNGWYMGLKAQVAFVLIYYFVSRFWRWDELMLTLYMGVSALVYLFGILNRFGSDPLGMYEGLDEYYIPQFLSTLGQSTWYSSYVCVMLPIGFFIYWQYEKDYIRILSAIYVAMGFMTVITDDADSGLFALVASISALFYFSFEDTKRMKRFIELLIIGLLGWRLVGLLQIAMPDKAITFPGLMTFGSQHPIFWLFIAFLCGVYYLIKKAEKNEGFTISKFKIVRNAYFVFLAAVIVLTTAYIVINTKGMLPDNLSSTNQYLLFDDSWGNARGSSWRITVDSLIKSATGDPMRFIFGAGPDGFFNTVYKYHGDELHEIWGQDTILTCAHNEWLTQIVNIGLLGGLAYLGIFIGAIIRFAKKSKECPETIAPILCICSYMAHNFFCYQQIICTPMIFIIIGAGETLCRIGKEPIWEVSQ